MDDTPAAKAGILAGDLITQIDDVAVQGLTLEQAVNKMKGPVDTKTRLKITRKGVDQPIEVTVVREIIRVRPVSFHAEGDDIGYIRITSFNEQTTDGLKKAIAYLSKTDPAGQARWLRRRPPQQPGRFARPGGLGFERLHGARRGGLDAGPHALRKPSVSPRGVATSPRASRWSCPDQRRIGVRFRNRGRRPARPQARDLDRHPFLRQGIGADHHPAGQRQRRIGAHDGALFHAVRPFHPGAGRQAGYRSGAGCSRRPERPRRAEGRGVDARPSVGRRARSRRVRNPTFRPRRRTTRRLRRPTTSCAAASRSMPMSRQLPRPPFRTRAAQSHLLTRRFRPIQSPAR